MAAGGLIRHALLAAAEFFDVLGEVSVEGDGAPGEVEVGVEDGARDAHLNISIKRSLVG
jgi:hypothetical protein